MKSSTVGERRVRRVTILELLACENFELRFSSALNQYCNQGDTVTVWKIHGEFPLVPHAEPPSSSSAFLGSFLAGFLVPQGGNRAGKAFSLALFSYILGVFTRALKILY
jgi:hypothetical protein